MKFKILFLSLFFVGFSFAQTKPATKPTRILFVFDASNSMRTKYDGLPRIDHAKKLFNRFIDSLAKLKNYEFALRMYGSQTKYPPGDCNDTKLMVPFSKGNVAAIKAKVAAAKPTGITPIEHSLTESANDFPDNKAYNTIILITDGIEECKGDPCAARQKLFEKGIVFKPCIIGIGLTEEQAKTFECVGNYFSYEDSQSFNNVVNVIQVFKYQKTTVQLNLLDIGGKPTETNVNATFYDEKTGDVVYNYVHTMNKFGVPDTIPVYESKTYRIVVHTIPQVEKTGVVINQGVHNIIPIDAPQGILGIKRENQNSPFNFNDKIRYIVRKSGSMQTLHVKDLHSIEKYLVGTYDIEILTLPRIYFKDVKVNQSVQIDKTIPDGAQAIVLLPDFGDACLLQNINGELKWVCNLANNQKKQILNIQPGSYVIEFRSTNLKQSIYTIEKKFTIKAAEQQTVDLNKY